MLTSAQRAEQFSRRRESTQTSSGVLLGNAWDNVGGAGADDRVDVDAGVLPVGGRALVLANLETSAVEPCLRNRRIVRAVVSALLSAICEIADAPPTAAIAAGAWPVLSGSSRADAARAGAETARVSKESGCACNSAAGATLEQPALDAADFCFDPIASSMGASSRPEASSVSARSRKAAGAVGPSTAGRRAPIRRALPRRFLEHGPGKPLRAVVLGSDRTDHVAGEGVRLIAKRRLILGQFQREAHDLDPPLVSFSKIVPVKRSRSDIGARPYTSAGGRASGGAARDRGR